MAEAEAVARTVSPSAGRRYGLARTCRVRELPRSTVYAAKQRSVSPLPAARKRGPKTAWSDLQLTELIRTVLEGSPWLGEGYRKVWAQLRAQEIRTSKARVLRLIERPACWRRRAAAAPMAPRPTTAPSPPPGPTKCGERTPPPP